MKSAFLIAAHGNFDMLEYLIRALDYKNNDIYIHIDKKCGNIDFSQFQNITQYSKVECLKDRINVLWGGISQPHSTFLLLESAIRGGQYDYFHLISGVDFPLLSNEEIDSFLTRYQGIEFVGFAKENKDLLSKLGYYHLFYNGFLGKLPCSKRLDELFMKIQSFLHIHQFTNIREFSKGCNWWSITYDLAVSLLKEKRRILKQYRYTLCCDEVFLQTFIKQHPVFFAKVFDKENEYRSCMRLIDWNRGTPYVYTKSDYEELNNSKYFFARKFGNIDVIKDFVLYRAKTNVL